MRAHTWRAQFRKHEFPVFFRPRTVVPDAAVEATDIARTPKLLSLTYHSDNLDFGE